MNAATFDGRALAVPRRIPLTVMPVLSSAASLESRHCAPWAAGAAVAVMAMCCPAAASGQAAAAQQFRAVPQANVDPQVLRLPVVEGTDLRFTRLSRTQGLSQARVTQIVQDDRGFMWLGTQYGLNRYDGYRFKVFKHTHEDTPSNSSSLCGVYIYALFKDRSGNLWVGCHQYLDRFDPLTETFVHYQFDAAATAGRSGSVVHISQDNDGMLWLSTGRGLYRFDPRSGKTTRFQHVPDDPGSLSSDNIESTGLDRSGVFWVATSEGLDAFDRGSAQVQLHIPIHEAREMSFYEDSSGTFWVLYSSNNGLAIFNRETRRLTRVSFASQDHPGDPLTGVISMLEDRDGALWIGTQSDGILKYDRDRHQFIRYRNDPTNPESLAENRVTTLYQDLEGIIWVGLGATEPVYFSTRRSPFTALPFDSGNPANLGATLVNVIYEDSQGNLWTGTTGALSRLDRKRARYTRFAVPGGGISSDVLSLVEDRSGALWIGTSGQGLYRLDPGAKRFKVYRHNGVDAASLANDTVTRLLIDHRGTLWAATLDGVSHFDTQSQRFVTYRSEQPDRSSYLSLAEDPRGFLWVGTHSSGLLRFEPQSGRFERFRHEPGQLATLTDNRVNSIHVDQHGVIWAATQNGLNRLDPTSGLFSSYTETDGLASNAVSCILEDSSGDLWMGTNNGISRLDPRKGTFKNYSVADGLPGPDFTGWGDCFKSASGEMFFGGFAGAVAFHLEDVSDNAYTPPIVLTEFDLFGTPVWPGPDSPLERAIGYTDAVTLSHAQNSFALEFSALSFGSPTTNRYRYMLEGLDANWHVVGSDRRLASYTTLPAGVYTFRVQGATSRGPWSDPGAALRVRIVAPWWGTLWFKALVAVLLVLSVLGVYYYRVSRIARQFGIRLEERVDERTRIARELHDTVLQSTQGLLFLFQAFSEKLSRDDPMRGKAESALDRAEQAMAELRDRVGDLRTPDVLGNDLGSAFAKVGKDLSASSSATLNVVVKGSPRSLKSAVSEDIYRIGCEALQNAFAHSGARAIEVEILYESKHLLMRIRDDGSGIDPNVLAAGARAGHYGLVGMRERARRLGAKFDVWSEEKAGTEIELSVPAAVAYLHPEVMSLWRRIVAGGPFARA
jgi:ligand-binding sensor domain-containing protein/signal transduction histidine kinase